MIYIFEKRIKFCSYRDTLINQIYQSKYVNSKNYSYIVEMILPGTSSQELDQEPIPVKTL